MNYEELIKKCEVHNKKGVLIFDKILFRKYAKELICPNCNSNNFIIIDDIIIQYDCRYQCNFVIIYFDKFDIGIGTGHKWNEEHIKIFQMFYKYNYTLIPPSIELKVKG